MDTIDAIRFSTTAVLDAFASDGVRYLELRTTPRAVVAAGISKHDYVSTVLDCISEFTQKDQNKMPTYLILSVDRKNSASVAMQTIDLAIEFRTRGVVGVDLCGNPAKGDVSIFQDAFLKARLAGLKVTLHFAEVPASSTETELRTLLSYEPDRLGHIIHVPPEIVDEIARRKLGLEICLSCNVLAKLTEGGFDDHHFGYWRRKDCPVILCVSHPGLQLLLHYVKTLEMVADNEKTDDVGVFGSPLSNEYWLAAKHFALSREDLVKLSMLAVNAIFAGEEEKKRLRRIMKDFENTL